MQVQMESIVCKFGGDPAIYLREEAILRKTLQTDRRTDGQTDRQTDDGRRAIALAHSWNELIICKTKPGVTGSVYRAG